MKLKVWTAAYSPFIMGGNVHAPIMTEVTPSAGPFDLGKGYVGYIVTNPNNGQQHIAESETGAFIGTSLEQVTEDIKQASKTVMREQIEEAKKTVLEAVVLSPKEFWGRFR